MSSVRAFLLLLCCVVFSALSKAQTTNPGVVVRLSQSALDYTAQRAIGLLSQHLRSGVSIPDASGGSEDSNYSLTNMSVRDFRLPGSTVTVNRGRGVSWFIHNAEMSVGGNCGFLYYFWFIPIRGSASFTISLSNVSIDIQISLGRASTGRPTVSMLGCSGSVGRASGSFSGSYINWLYNYVYSSYEEQVKGEIAKGLCDAVKSTIENDGTRKLNDLQTRVTILDTYSLDYSLVQAPVYGYNYIESFHSGQFRYNGQGAPFQPSPMPPRYSSSMVAIYVSDYVIQSLAYVMQKHGQLSHTLTKNDLPADSRNNLDMTCERGCLGKFFPSVASNYSESSAELITNVVRPPTVKIVGEIVKINFEAEMKVVVRGQDGRHVDLVKIVFGGFVHGSAWIENDKIIGRVGNASVANISLTVLQPVVNRNIPVGTINSIISNYIQTYTQAQIVPQLNRLGAIGFQLPKLSAISFIGPQLKLRDGFFLVETNVA